VGGANTARGPAGCGAEVRSLQDARQSRSFTYHIPYLMAAFTGSPPPRRKTRLPSRQPALEPPPRRVGRFASTNKPASRLPTPASFIKEDASVGSMDVDEDTLQPMERALRQDTVFAKSEEMLVTFHGHLPSEVKHVLKNAGERSYNFPAWWMLFIVFCCRLLPRRVRW
jgi:hypothetical protein